jgi:adenylate cyclase class 2
MNSEAMMYRVGINGRPFFLHDGLKTLEGLMNPGGSLETEVKLRVAELEPIRHRLAALGFAEREALQPEESILWDRGGELLERGCALRVRRYAGGAWVTFKGPKQNHPLLKIRPEHETRIEDPAALEEILHALGYRPVLRMAKSRAVWTGGRLVACLDETPLGRFLELEGEAGAIRVAMEALAIGADAVEPRSYPTLYREAGLA